MNDRLRDLAGPTIEPPAPPSRPGRISRASLLLFAAIWTSAVGVALWWNLAHMRQTADDLARLAARSAIETALSRGVWAAMLESSQGYQASLESRATGAGGPETSHDTPSSRRPSPVLPLIRLTGLRQPENPPDSWERGALEAVAGGRAEFSSIEPLAGTAYLRLMRPVRIQASCLDCHGSEGYKEGDLCGGISAAVSMSEYGAIAGAHQREEVLAHGLVWALGLASLGAGSRQVRRRLRERELAQEALQRGEERFRVMFEDSPVAIWEEDFSAVKDRCDALRRSGIVDLRGHFERNPEEVAELASRVRVLAANHASTALFGTWAEDLPCSLPRHFTANSLGVFEREIVALAEGATRFRDEDVRVGAGERSIVIDLTLSVVRGHEDSLSRVLVSFVDITERRRAEEALRESAARLNKAQEIAHFGSWEFDLASDRLTWSDEVYRIFGLPRDAGATSYETFLDFVHPEDRAAVDAAYAASLRDGRDSYEIEHRVIRRSTGEIRHVREKCEHVRDASGRIVRSIGMVHDITEERLTESALRSRNEELTRFNRVATDRELRMIELKREVNELCRKGGEPPRYPLDFSDPETRG